MSKHKIIWCILIPPSLKLEALLPKERFKIITVNPKKESDLISVIKDADILVKSGQRIRIGKNIIEKAENLKLIYKTHEFKHDIDNKTALERNIKIFSVDIGTRQIAEHVLTMILMLSRNILHADAEVRNGTYKKFKIKPTATSQEEDKFGNWIQMPPAKIVLGKRLGIIGLGEVGSQVAKICSNFGMKVKYYDLIRHLDFEKETRIQYSKLRDILKNSDFISLHAKINPQKPIIIGEKEISLMKKSAHIINTSRGRVLDQEALYNAIKSNKIAGAALDVFEKEPLSSNSPLILSKKIILTPHIAGGRDVNIVSSQDWVEGVKEICSNIIKMTKNMEK